MWVIEVDETYSTLNHLLVHMFNDILKIEEKALMTDVYKDISVTDMHVIEAIGYEGSKNMSSVAKSLSVTVGTLTIAINNLVKKDYVKRVRSAKDRRVVLISLTARGQGAFMHHRLFHEDMIKEIYKQVDEDELKILAKALSTINRYFHDKYDMNE